ncbi:secondary thiamine-phosphate synthase enzyme YjbQ, partial [uncultured Maricaulis sp.]|uniref:secondary thiamine-phosphate synthase enzyme YjbQ n=1 Tax=uncultured Maricaulis sp. TaxID=174710 RepID=UPI002600AA6E
MPLHHLHLPTTGPGLYEITHAAQNFASEANAADGLLTAYVRHTSCSLVIQENADPDVQRDLNAFFRRLVPPADDMPAHIKAALTQTSIGIPVAQGELLLGTWQGLYLFEHRDRPHRRE